MSVSVLITCHSEERFIEEAVRSVASQTVFDRVEEIIVVDDGSSDGSRAILLQLAEGLDKLRIVESPGLGPAAARNLAVRQARGEFLALLDGDDYWAPEKLARQLPAFDRDEIGLVYGDFIHFSVENEKRVPVAVRRLDPASGEQLRDYFVHDAPIVPSTAIIRRAVFDDVGLMDESLRIGEETEFHLRVAERWRLCHVPGAFTYKRQHPGQLSRRLDAYLANAEVVTQRFAARHPELEPLAGRRMARCRVKASADCALKGEWRNAVRHGLAAIRLAPRYPRAWGNLALVLVPPPVVRVLYDALRTAWHAIRQRRQRGMAHARTSAVRP